MPAQAPDDTPNIMLVERVIIVSLSATQSTRWHPKNYMEEEGYNIILACQPKYQIALKHCVDGQGYNIILSCQPKHQM